MTSMASGTMWIRGTWRNRVLATFDYEQFGRLKASTI